MRNTLIASLAVVALAASCRPTPASPTPSPTVALTRADIVQAALTLADVGNSWKPVSSPTPNTVQIGGRIGAANIRPSEATVTVSFSQKDGSGFISNTLYLLRDTATADVVMTTHKEADALTTWRQERDDGGSITFKRLGRITELPLLGDEMYTARLEADVKVGKQTQATKRTIEYVVYRIGPVVSFVVAQDAHVATVAKRQEARLARVAR